KPLLTRTTRLELLRSLGFPGAGSGFRKGTSLRRPVPLGERNRVMVRLLGVVAAGTVLVLTAGCSLDSFTLSARGKGKETMVQGSPDELRIALGTQLQQMGVAVNVSRPRADTIKMVGKTQRGDKFVLYLKSQSKGEQGDRTQMRVEWDNNADEDFW